MRTVAISLVLASGCEGASEPVLSFVVEPFDGDSCGRSRCDAGRRDASTPADGGPPMDLDRDGSWDYADAGDSWDAGPDAGDWLGP